MRAREEIGFDHEKDALKVVVGVCVCVFKEMSSSMRRFNQIWNQQDLDMLEQW